MMNKSQRKLTQKSEQICVPGPELKSRVGICCKRGGLLRGVRGAKGIFEGVMFRSLFDDNCKG